MKKHENFLKIIIIEKSTLGVIGVGNIGKAVICRALAFGMTVVGNDICAIDKVFTQETGLRIQSREALLANSDFVSINCDLNPTSFHLLGEKEFSLMKPCSYLINTARGSIIDETALIKALESKRIAGAALDVFETEPLSLDNPLKKLGNCLFAPHNANSSPSAWQRVHQNTINNLLAQLRKSE